jgi:hypothetical protein
VPRPKHPRAVTALLATLAVASVGCGGGGSREGRSASAKSQVKNVVTEFAAASDADACDYLTDKALERIYGGREGCLRRSRGFEGGAVKIRQVRVLEQGQAKVSATSLGGRQHYTIELTRVGCGRCITGTDAGDWRIEDITQP